MIKMLKGDNSLTTIKEETLIAEIDHLDKKEMDKLSFGVITD